MSLPSVSAGDSELIAWVRSIGGGGGAPQEIRQAALELKRSLTKEFKAEQRKKILEYLEGVLEKTRGVAHATGNLLEWTEGDSEAAYTSRYNQACRLKAQKLNEAELGEARNVISQLVAKISQSKKILRLEVVLLEISQQLERLAKNKDDAAQLAREAKASLPEASGADNALAASLVSAIENARNQTIGYVYLKQWTLADGTRWLKVGITNNPSRRDAEQNVLPVPAVTLCLMETQGMDQAAAIEKALHQQLASQKVTGAGNRELFHLSDAQLAALMAAMSL